MENGTVVSYLVFLLFGISVLFPYNAVLRALDFFRDQFDGTAVSDTYQQYINFTFTFSNTFFVTLLVFFKFDSKVRIAYSSL